MTGDLESPAGVLVFIIRPCRHPRATSAVRARSEAELQAIFEEFGTDGDGFVSLAEYKKVVVTRLGEGVTDEQMTELFALTDSDGDKLITSDEFRASFG